jgi:MFS family permease
VNLPIGLVGLLLAARLLPSGRAKGTAGSTQLDWRGVLTLSPGVALLVFGLSEIGSQGHVTTLDAIWILAGLALIGAFTWRGLRIERPLVDVRLLRGRGFSAASATTFIAGMALFGSMLLLPLYYQVARGESALYAGLLVAPQGLGAAAGMRYSGRLTDRIGAGRVVLGGLVILMLGTVPFAFVGATTSYALLLLGVFVRGIGLGFTMMPAMAAAYATLERNQVPRATPMLNVIQRIGGSIGTALLAVVLQRQLATAVGATGGGGLGGVRTAPPGARARLADPVATAFAHTYLWALALTAVALVPAAVLAVTESRERARKAAQAEPPPTSQAAAIAG